MARRNAQGNGERTGPEDRRGAGGGGSESAARPNDGLRLAEKLIAESPDILGPPSLTEKTDGDKKEVTSISHGIKTVDDLLRHIEADLTQFEVSSSEATVWEAPSGEGKIPLYRVWVRLKQKAGPGVRECVEAMIAAAAGSMRRPPVKLKKRKTADLWQVLVVADPHFGKYAWKETCAHDYDLPIAEAAVKEAGDELIETGDEYAPARRTIAMCGDLFHYDTPAGTTTGGTPLERDGRLQKMLQVGCDTLLGLIERSAETAPTDVVIVPGNHDTTLTWAFHRIVQERFRNDGRVTVETGYRPRKYATYGKNLLGFTHGDKAKKNLPQLMSLEAAAEWSRCPYREWHTGHLHHAAAKSKKFRVEDDDILATYQGVVVRTAPTVCGNDDWHFENGFTGARRAMETFLYSKDAGLVAMHVAAR